MNEKLIKRAKQELEFAIEDCGLFSAGIEVDGDYVIVKSLPDGPFDDYDMESIWNYIDKSIFEFHGWNNNDHTEMYFQITYK